nr:Ig-like domain-containing protein [Bacteroidota bacterium]
EQYDTTALRIYRENLPGYNVVGINCNNIIGSLGAIHCITKSVGVQDPLLIAHARRRDVSDTVQQYEVNAYIRHRTGVESTTLYYKSATDTDYVALPMYLSDTTGNIWTAIMPSFDAGTEVQYYIEATANNGMQQVRPIVAPEGYFRFNVTGELINQPPFAAITYPEHGAIFNLELGGIDIAMESGDADGDVDHLELWINGDSITSIYNSPYHFEWNFPDAGEYSLQLRAIDDDGANSLSEVVNVTVEHSTSIHPADNDPVFYFPNPIGTQLYVITAQPITAFRMYNAFGEEISIRSLDTKNFDVSHLIPGFYVMKVFFNQHWSSFIVVK